MSTPSSSTPAISTDVLAKTSSDYYFDSYSHYGLHEDLLKDSVRTKAYFNAISMNKHLFKDKVVLDCGAGLGLMSLAAAKAGAKKVIAIERTEIAVQAKQIIQANKLDNVITVIQDKVENVTTLPDGITEVDVIIHECMGYFLFYEHMIDTVLYARDKWLRKDGKGVILPDKIQMFICAIEDEQYRKEKINYWNDVYGFRMKPVQELALQEPLIDSCEADQVISNAALIHTLDLNTAKFEKKFEFSTEFALTIQKNWDCHALLTFFNVEFTKTHNKIWFSTGPKSEWTHWKQCVMYLRSPLHTETGNTVFGRIHVIQQDDKKKEVDITLAAGLKQIPKTSTLFKLR